MATKEFEDWMDAITKEGNRSQNNSLTPGVGAVLASGPTITPTHRVHHVSGIVTIDTIATTNVGVGETLVLIPDGTWATTDVGGNIAVATAAFLSQALWLVFDGRLWFASY